VDEFFAHSTGDESRGDWHPLRDHLIATAQLAEAFGERFGTAKAAQLAGLLHDLGKYTKAFQARLSGGDKVDHATAGAKEIVKFARGWSDRRDKAMAELIAFAIAGHHAGLADRTGDGSLGERLKKSLEPLDPVWRREITPDADGLMPSFDWSKDKAAFQLGFLGRMMFSCLVDADYRDTEAFYCQVSGERRDRDWPALNIIIDGLIAAFDACTAQKQAGASQSDVNRLRNDVLRYVRARAGEPAGLFTLTVPTGGGKTLTSLGFALDHAKAHGLHRIIYAIPFTSVIDQTASVFQEVLGNDPILEYHSAIDEEKIGGREQRDKLRLAMEDWAAPVIVTTNVQLFESLFANRPSRCRKLHNIAGSVIVLDEAQTIPLGLLRPCMEAMRELARNYRCSIVLCTATQPALGAPDFRDGLPLEGRELAPDPPGLAKRLKRVQIRSSGEITDDDLITALDGHLQGLVIVNSRKHALALYRAAKDAGLDGLIHLTTRQYAAHRREILDTVKQRLKDGQPCRLIATSLVEAGVDLDFPRVWRAEAGLDQIAQAAGRCNREGRRALDDSIVTVFKAPDNPPPFEIKQLAADFARMAHKHEDLLSPDAMRDYFGEVYWRKGDGLDAKAILPDFRLSGPEADFAYRTVAEKFRMIESGMAPVIIARDEKARKAVEKLGFDNIRSGAVARELQTFIVQVPPKARNLLLANGHARFELEARFGDQFCVLQTDSLYEPETGLLWEDADYLGLENSIT
jgi:CRISPR-associated endonuclease/helicase Cas3